MLMKNRRWNAKFNHGLCSDTIVEAADEAEAIRAAYAHYRKELGIMRINDFPIKFVVNSVTEVLD